MRQKTLLILALAGIIVGAGLWFMPRPAQGGPGASADIDPAAVNVILIERASGESTELRRDQDGTWSIEHGGRRSRARGLMLTQLVQAVREIRVRRVLAEEPTPATLDGYGLLRADKVTLHLRDGSRHGVSMGATLPSGGVAAMLTGRRDVVLLPAELRVLLFAPAGDFVDPALLQLRALDIERLTLEPRGAAPFTLLRQFTRWVLVDVKDLPCDGAACDQLRNLVGALSVTAVAPSTGELLSDFARFPKGMRIKAEGAGRSESLELAEDGQGRVFAIVEGGREIFEVAESAHELLAARSEDLRDRHVLRAETADIVRVEVLRAGHAAEGAVVRTGDLWDAQWSAGGKLVSRAADALERARYLERLASLRWRSFGAVPGPSVPVFQLTITSGSAGDRRQVLEFRKDAGDWVATDPDLGLSGTLQAADVRFLEEPITALLERSMIGAGAYFAVGGVRLRLEGHDEVTVKTTIPKPGADILGFVTMGAIERSIPEEIWRPVVTRLIAPTTARVLGRERLPEYGLDQPQVDASFLELERPSADGIPEERKGQWRSLRIGQPVDGGFAATFDGDPACLVFVLTEQDLAVFKTLAVFATR